MTSAAINHTPPEPTFYNIEITCPSHPAEWHRERAKGLGGSDANTLCSDKKERDHEIGRKALKKLCPCTLEGSVS